MLTNKSIFVLMIIGVIATTRITSTVATSDVFAGRNHRGGNSGGGTGNE